MQDPDPSARVPNTLNPKKELSTILDQQPRHNPQKAGDSSPRSPLVREQRAAIRPGRSQRRLETLSPCPSSSISFLDEATLVAVHVERATVLETTNEARSHYQSCLEDSRTMTMLRHCFIAGLASTAMMLGTAFSKADTYSYATTSVGGPNWVNISASVNGNTMSGSYYDQYVTTLATSSSGANAVTTQSFCVDLFHDVSSSYSALANTALPLASAFGGTTTAPAGINPTALGTAAWIVNTFGYGNLTDAQWAGVQIASWKAEFETNSTDLANLKLDNVAYLSQGNVQFSGGSSQAALTYAAQYLAAWANAGYATSSAILVNYASDSSGNHYQYQLIAVPEPSTLVIAGLGGLGLVGYGLRRRRT